MADRCAVVVIAESMLPQVNIPTVWTDATPTPFEPEKETNSAVKVVVNPPEWDIEQYRESVTKSLQKRKRNVKVKV